MFNLPNITDLIRAGSVNPSSLFTMVQPSPSFTATVTQQGGAGNDSLLGTTGNDSLNGAGGNDTLNGLGGLDTLWGGDGNDRFVLSDWTSSTTIDGGSGIDTLDYSGLEVAGGLTVNLAISTVTKGSYGGLTGTDTISNIDGVIGTRYDDALYGNALANQLSGGDGSDTLNGGAGDDLMEGGAGHDHFVQLGASAFDWDTLDGGDGNDHLSYASADFSVEVDLTAGSVKKYRAFEMLGIDTLRNIEHVVGSRYDDTMSGSANADELGGHEGNDRIRGNGGNDTLKGYTGDDSLGGDAGNDTLDGGDGDDTLLGGAGNNSINGSGGDDRIVQDQLGSLDQIDGGDGLDLLDYSAATFGIYHLGLKIDLKYGTVILKKVLVDTLEDKISNIESVIGSRSADNIFGDDKANTLSGFDGADTILAAGGDDTLNGGTGNDTLNGEDGDDVINQGEFRDSDYFEGGKGSDTLNYNIGAPEYAHIEVNLSLHRVDKYYNGVIRVGVDKVVNIERIVGTGSDDKFYGNSLANILLAGAGKDTLNGAGGNDLLCGEDGNDAFNFTIADGNVTIDGGSGFDTVDYRGLESPRTTVNLNLLTGQVLKYQKGSVVGIDQLRSIEAVTATYYDDTLSAGAGDDALSGSDGNDRINLLALAGSHTLDGGAHSDTLDYSQASVDDPDSGLMVDLVLGTVSKHAQGRTLGIDRIRSIETIIGSASADTMSGSDKADVLFADAGNDILRGGAGNDALDGGKGADTIAGGSGNDSVNGGAGDDLYLQDDELGLDLFIGGDGVDTLDYSQIQLSTGGLAIKLDATTGAEVLKYRGGFSNSSDSLASIENIIGSRYNDTFAGSTGADDFDGGAGNDSMAGGAGNDTLVGGAGDDRLLQDDPFGSDWLIGGDGFDTADYSLATVHRGWLVVDLGAGTVVKSQPFALVGIDRIADIESFIGSRHEDKISGSQNAERLDGGAGDDSLTGGGGADTLLGGSGNDLYLFAANFGQDRVINPQSTDSSEIDIVQFNNIDANSVLFQRQGDDLQISIAFADDTIVVEDWYAASGSAAHGHSYQFKTDAITLDGGVVDQQVTISGAAPVSMAFLLA